MERLCKALSEQYGRVVDGPLSLRQVSAHEVASRNYFVSVGADVRFVLKVETLGSHAELKVRLAKLRLQAQLATRHKLIPVLIPAKGGNVAVVQGNRLLSLSDFRDGHDYPGTRAAFVDAACGLAELHRLLRDTRARFPLSPLYKNLDDMECEIAVESLRRIESSNTFAAKLRPFVEDGLRDCYRDLKAQTARHSLPRQLVHFDFHPANAIFQGNRLAAILDLDSILYDFRMQAVAFACSRHVQHRSPWPFLAAYRRIDALSADEIRCYPMFVRQEAIRSINWLLRVNALQGNNVWWDQLTKHFVSIRRSQSLESQFQISDEDLLARLAQADAIPAPPSFRAKAA